MPSFVVVRSRNQICRQETSSVMPADSESLHSKALKIAKFIEKGFRELKNWPQYKYVTRPVYKFFVPLTNPVVATALSFLSADLLIHQMSFPLAEYIYNQATGACEPFHYTWCPIATASWLILAAPVMYSKYYRDVIPPERVMPAPIAKSLCVKRLANSRSGSPLLRA